MTGCKRSKHREAHGIIHNSGSSGTSRTPPPPKNAQAQSIETKDTKDKKQWLQMITHDLLSLAIYWKK